MYMDEYVAYMEQLYLVRVVVKHDMDAYEIVCCPVYKVEYII